MSLRASENNKLKKNTINHHLKFYEMFLVYSFFHTIGNKILIGITLKLSDNNREKTIKPALGIPKAPLKV